MWDTTNCEYFFVGHANRPLGVNLNLNSKTMSIFKSFNNKLNKKHTAETGLKMIKSRNQAGF